MPINISWIPVRVKEIQVPNSYNKSHPSKDTGVSGETTNFPQAVFPPNTTGRGSETGNSLPPTTPSTFIFSPDNCRTKKFNNNIVLKEFCV